MNKIEHQDTPLQNNQNKMPLSQIHNVRHCTTKNKFALKDEKGNFFGEFKLEQREQRSDENIKHSQSILESTSENIPTNKSSNLLSFKSDNMNNAHPLSHLLDSRFQKTSVLPPLITPKVKKEQKQSAFSTEIDVIKEEDTSIHRFNTSKIIISPRAFLVKSIQENEVTRFKVERESTCFNNNLTMVLQGERTVKIKCERKFKIFGTKASFQIDQSCYRRQREEELAVVQSEVGWVESCFDGSTFNVYETSFNNLNNELVATIEYFKDISQHGGPRRVRIYYKDKKNQFAALNPLEENLKEFHTKNPNDLSVQCLETLIPIHDKESNTYSISIKGKYQSCPSLHNIIFVDKTSKPLLKFYKVEEKEYYLECFGPISSFVGCAYVYSSFIWKLVSQ